MIRSRDDIALLSRSACKGISQVEPLAEANSGYLTFVLQKALRSFVSPLLFVLHRLGTCMLHHGNDLTGNGCLASFAFTMRFSLTPFDLYACACRSSLCPALWAYVETASRPMASRSCSMLDWMHCLWLHLDMAAQTGSTHGIIAATLGQCTSYRGLYASCPWHIMI
jgi:hypothetical protein